MDPKIVASFVAPISKYWDTEFARTLKLASSTTRPASFRASDVVVTLLINGDLNGEVHYVIDGGTMQAVYSSLTGTWVEEIDDEVTDKFVGISKKLANAATRRLAKAGFDVKVRVVGSTISDGELMGPTDVIGQLEHLFAKRPGVAEEDHVRIWVSTKESSGAGKNPSSGATLDLLDDSEPEELQVETPAVPEMAPADVVQARRFELVDEEGATRAVLGTLGNGSPHLVLSDSRGRMRAAVALSKSGAPRIMFFDEVGERIYEEPTLVYKRKAA